MTSDRRPHLLDHSLADLEATFEGWGEPSYRARQVARWLLQRGVTDFESMSDLPKALRQRLASEFNIAPPPVLAVTAADDGATTKVLLDLGLASSGGPYSRRASSGASSLGAAVETVRMDYDPDEDGRTDRTTVCVSTQAGCAMGCVFCATGQQGFTRNLTPAEIVQQVLHFSRDRRVTNVVFMGMGEPLANYNATLAAVHWLIDPDGLDMRARGITISTVGLPRAVRRLAEERLQIGLTISLHAPDDELRHRLIPTSSGTTLDELIDCAREYIEATGRRVTFAYALLEGVNDAPEQARALAARIRGIQAHVNLIPYNPTAGPDLRRPSMSRVRAFQRALHAEGVNATIRMERGVEIAAACGQLRTDVLANPATVGTLRGAGPQPLVLVD